MPQPPTSLQELLVIVPVAANIVELAAGAAAIAGQIGRLCSSSCTGTRQEKEQQKASLTELYRHCLPQSLLNTFSSALTSSQADGLELKSSPRAPIGSQELGSV